MKLLILTQSVDKQDPVLGFFCRWVEEFAKRAESVTVIALGVGEYSFAPNVKVLSLGKESGKSKFKYLLRFYKYIWGERKNYDAILVHMNEEYVILGWKLWFILGKRIFLWRNHAKGGFWTYLAVLFSKKVFYTSPASFTARFKKAVQMPVGVDTEFFKPDSSVPKQPNSILFLGRIAPVKKVLEFVEWFKTLGGEARAVVAGEALPRDKDYETLVKNRAPEKVKFVGAVDESQALRLYQSHETYVNMTPAGSFDKTIFEAAATGTRVKVANPDLKFMEALGNEESRDFVVKNHSLKVLMDKLGREMS
ncbi:MAG: glycosyltransferase [Minisyncoccia bacterium]